MSAANAAPSSASTPSASPARTRFMALLASGGRVPITRGPLPRSAASGLFAIAAVEPELTLGHQRKQPIRPVCPQNRIEGVSFATIIATNSQLQEGLSEVRHR